MRALDLTPAKLLQILGMEKRDARRVCLYDERHAELYNDEDDVILRSLGYRVATLANSKFINAVQIFEYCRHIPRMTPRQRRCGKCLPGDGAHLFGQNA